ncbi:MAG: pilus assembly protein PilM [Candidatus Riflebacteria bacterium]|nr:pilus assembly protein PilM [Candidatus Riflebacteria bacterium]
MNLFTEYVALDIGTHALKALSLDPGASGEGFTIADCLHEELPPGLVCGGFTNPTVSDPVKFAKIVKQFTARLKNHKEGFFVGLPDRWVKLHLVDLLVKPEEMASHEYIGWRLQKQLLPQDMVGEMLVDYQTLSANETTDGLSCRILVGMVRKSMIDLLSGIFANLQIEVMVFDTSTLGEYNLLEDSHPEKTLDRSLIICHIGHETTVIKIFEKSMLVYERVIEVGGEAFGKLFAEAENISFDEAQAQKMKRRFFPISRQELLAAIPQRHLFERVFGNWLRELHVTFRFYQDRGKIMGLPPIYLSGGSALFEGLPEFMTDFFGTQCRRLNPLQELPIQNEIRAEIMAKGPLLAPALGLLSC